MLGFVIQHPTIDRPKHADRLPETYRRWVSCLNANLPIVSKFVCGFKQRTNNAGFGR